MLAKASVVDRAERPGNTLSRQAARAVWRFLSSCLYQIDQASDSLEARVYVLLGALEQFRPPPGKA